jgi:aminopeptidase N
MRRILEEASKRFSTWAENPEANPIYPALRGSVWRAGVEKDPARAVELLKKEWYTTKSVDGKVFCLRALAAVKDEELIKSAIIPLNFNTEPPSNAVPSVDMHVLGVGMAANTTARQLQWEFMQKNWDAIVAKLGNPIVVDRFINVSLRSFTDESAIDEIDAFFKDRDTKSFDRTLGTVKDRIRGRAAYKSRDTASLKEWLNANGYL